MSTGHQFVRQFLVEELKRDLVGPDKLNEELPERPNSRYLTGILYPKNTQLNPEEDQDSGEAADKDDGLDQGVVMATTTNPSAIGLTFTVATGTEIEVVISAAVYLETPEEGRRSIWRRQPLEISPIHLEVMGNRIERKKIDSGLMLMARYRKRPKHHIVTLSLMNTSIAPPEEDQNKYCFFQPEIIVKSVIDGTPIFLGRNQDNTYTSDPDRRLNALLYRHSPEFGVGHGCAVEWDEVKDGIAGVLRTSLIPVHEILQFSPDPPESYKALEMKFLAEANASEITHSLSLLSSNYLDWINRLSIDEIPGDLIDVADTNIKACKDAADRINQGIDVLQKNTEAMTAFQLANKAMLTQRARSVWADSPKDERPNKPNEDNQHRWRPFQLAFILMCLPGVVNPKHNSRSIVDLLWFPTGGGKTEAYLGLTAFTIFLRRLRHPDSKGSGVTVLMRYTLRLLTIQQFQRAAILIMACEKLRQIDSAQLGTEPISLGLWVGGGATPNKLKKAQIALNKLLDGEIPGEGSPYQIQKCPWCGSKISPHNYRIESSMFIRCSDEYCDYRQDFPVYLVDEDIYTRQPTLMLGTVDKFARLPWMSETVNIFGGVRGEHLPPELIIQDELHLISGPLGSLVGIYETAIDLLCTQNGIGPKIIASTATIRRAGEQSKALFNRRFFQFPPPGIDSRDNFYSVQQSPEIRPGRLYIGVHAPGKSMKTALLRIYALLMQRIFEYEGSDELRDPYWTMVGYFNSTRELGGAVRLVADDVVDRIGLLAKRSGQKERRINYPAELYSQVPSNDIPRILEEMKLTLDKTGCMDVLLATNMLSVGVDVDRLGLMVVTGQPKLTAEYIQATSRVGRRYPGLVVSLYNWTRPRDRSHYERFGNYHSTIYSQVEPTSVTPFSSRARDRALHAVLISLVRHSVQEMNPEEAAEMFQPDSPEVKQIIELIVSRVQEIDEEEAVATRKQLMEIANRWDTIKQYGDLRYATTRAGAMPLMESAESSNQLDNLAFATLNSMREVEGEAGVSTWLMRRSLRE